MAKKFGKLVCYAVTGVAAIFAGLYVVKNFFKKGDESEDDFESFFDDEDEFEEIFSEENRDSRDYVTINITSDNLETVKEDEEDEASDTVKEDKEDEASDKSEE